MCSYPATTNSTSAGGVPRSIRLKSNSPISLPIPGASTGELPGHEDRRIFELGPLKVGVFGVALASSPLMSQTGNLKFIDELETVQGQADALRQEGSDLVVASPPASHTT